MAGCSIDHVNLIALQVTWKQAADLLDTDGEYRVLTYINYDVLYSSNTLNNVIEFKHVWISNGYYFFLLDLILGFARGLDVTETAWNLRFLKSLFLINWLSGLYSNGQKVSFFLNKHNSIGKLCIFVVQLLNYLINN